MLPLLRPGDRIFVDEANEVRSNLHDGDIIALRRNDAIVLKRILAMPGETISGDHRKVFRNDKRLDEPYLAPATGDDIPALITFSPRTVDAPVRLSDVVGQYRWTYWHAPSPTK